MAPPSLRPQDVLALATKLLQTTVHQVFNELFESNEWAIEAPLP